VTLSIRVRNMRQKLATSKWKFREYTSYGIIISIRYMIIWRNNSSKSGSRLTLSYYSSLMVSYIIRMLRFSPFQRCIENGQIIVRTTRLWLLCGKHCFRRFDVNYKVFKPWLSLNLVFLVLFQFSHLKPSHYENLGYSIHPLHDYEISK